MHGFNNEPVCFSNALENRTIIFFIFKLWHLNEIETILQTIYWCIHSAFSREYIAWSSQIISRLMVCLFQHRILKERAQNILCALFAFNFFAVEIQFKRTGYSNFNFILFFLLFSSLVHSIVLLFNAGTASVVIKWTYHIFHYIFFPFKILIQHYIIIIIKWPVDIFT